MRMARYFLLIGSVFVNPGPSADAAPHAALGPLSVSVRICELVETTLNVIHYKASSLPNHQYSICVTTKQNIRHLSQVLFTYLIFSKYSIPQLVNANYF